MGKHSNDLTDYLHLPACFGHFHFDGQPPVQFQMSMECVFNC